MESLLASLVSKYGFDIAAKMLGLNKQTSNPKYTFGMPFTDKSISFNPLQSLGRFGLNKIMSGGLSGIMGPAALMGGAIMLGRAFDPLNPNSRNYSPNLKGQVDYLSGISGMIGKDPNTGLMKYGPDSVLRGQNVVSMFGTNNYQDQLNKKIGYFEDRIKKGKNYSKKMYEKALKEKDDFFEYRANIRDKAKTRSTKSYSGPTGKDIHGGGNGGGGGFDTSAADKAGTSAGSGQGFSNKSGRGRTGYSKGGIASLWQK